MPSKLLILAGAPESTALDWSSSGLFGEFHETVARFAGIDSGTQTPTATSSAPGHAAWRLLSLDKAPIQMGFSQKRHASLNYGVDEPSAFAPTPDFLTTASLSFVSDGDGAEHNPVLSQFYEHSMAAHQELPSSQLGTQSTDQITSFLSDDGTTSFLSGDGSQAESTKGPLLFRGSNVLSDLKSIPSAAYLLKIQPQTMTCNLIVGIISISQPRAVKTRWGVTKHLIEILVGDETKAGFAITYWLPSDSVAESPLAGLRPRDIVLLQNVALNVFTKKVYGSSLRKDLTRVHLIHRVKLDAQDVGGYYSATDLSLTDSANPQLDKTRRVRDWVLHFVGGNVDRGDTDAGPRWARPPADDTQLL